MGWRVRTQALSGLARQSRDARSSSGKQKGHVITTRPLWRYGTLPMGRYGQDERYEVRTRRGFLRSQ